MTLKTQRLSDGSRLAYREQGAGTPIVLIHGVGLNASAWGPQIASLATTNRVIALDMPGHGRGDPLPVGATLPDFVAWCRDALSRLQLGPVALVGHSMGALIAAGVAVEHPDMITRVALLNGVFQRDAKARAAVEARAAEIRAGKVDLTTPLARWFTNTAADQDARKLTGELLHQVNIQGYATAYTAFAQGDATYAARFDKITCPLLALTGALDPNSTPEMSRQMAAVAQNGTAVVMDGARHMVNLTAPEEVTMHLRSWLKHPLLQEAQK